MLYSRFHAFGEDMEQPVLVFLHGLLGNSDDWRACTGDLQAQTCFTLDLPGHGQSRDVRCASFDETVWQVKETLIANHLSNRPVVLVGYSLGGRIAMHGVANRLFAPLDIRGLVVEGGHFGLISATDRALRWRHDQRWARRFRREPITAVLNDWYQQPVFASLNEAQTQHLVTRRSENSGDCVAHMLLATSLARQDALLALLKAQPVPVHYLFGAQDSKFSRLALESGFPSTRISKAGHNAHQDQPQVVARVLREQVLRQISLRQSEPV
ncbi:2-succinyl-6-hydroxy-2,4-cyclohexadiene-1-carboxylate synthase [Photobacterium galatheae]|uniref:Putative 2-succinyl-6-hydroxy-2,4-cyclohexadiene-1-carboxylate synthase n=1 Tax=Photobacterium galatheae TaxID=1654360 RepID=A0A066S140_9GAMM|nr:2-succinyl-6-hydroxy-2,4-cyclohexadiene-1-carboxylate synthase [Photobacterium galatheae]KDM93353.1 hypothetical protein EA58_01715 [Photobacterium galatheae]MCM0150476.1 2-succinyl-6-hydroxy-2,4-cyclohexadiene-1-carboxylate synthase [Photobacterium galatheae]